MNLSEAIKAIPASLFKLDKTTGRRKPDYCGIFVEAVSAILESRGVKFQRPTLVAVAEHVNLSSFQRAVALEAARRSEGGSSERIEKKVVKPAPRGADPIVGEKKVPRGTDPITGEKIKKAKKVKTTPKKSAAKVPAVKAEKKTGKKAAKPAKAPAVKAVVDPITGEPVGK